MIKIKKLVGEWNKTHEPINRVIMKTTDYTLEIQPTKSFFYTAFVGYLIKNGITEFMIMTYRDKPIIVILDVKIKEAKK